MAATRVDRCVLCRRLVVRHDVDLFILVGTMSLSELTDPFVIVILVSFFVALLAFSALAVDTFREIWRKSLPTVKVKRKKTLPSVPATPTTEEGV